MSALLPPQNRSTTMRFALMLTLSVTIAVMGLVADSTAVVIGAMLIAPLMNPIMTFSASVGLGLGRRAVQSAFLFGFGAIWAVLFSAVLARLLPSVEIGAEILSRTRPDVRDLIVAVAAGAAGAYATARSDMSGALPGVAVAVALVPPLAATGVLIQADELAFAEGAALLFLTNLLAIILSALVVLLATGVIPTVRLLFRSPRIAATAGGLMLATAMIAVPLTIRSLDAADSSKQYEDVAATVDQWLADRQLDVGEIDIDASTVTVELIGLDAPPAAFDLASRLVPVLGPDSEAIVRWDQRVQGEARADTPPVADPTEVATELIDRWLTGLAATGIRLDLLDLGYEPGEVHVEVSGPTAPPQTRTLPDELSEALGESVKLDVRWIQSFDPGLDGEDPTSRLERIVQAWIGPRSSVRLLDVSIDGSTVLVDLGADGQPLGLVALQQSVASAIDGVDRVEVRLLPLTLVEISPDESPVPDLI
jgi:uncharacterized hydrophobic protein (TIGR00271 family)